MHFSIVVPTLNAGIHWEDWIYTLKSQTLQAQTVLVIDSSSDDATAQKSREAGFEVLIIPKSEFNHGATRQLAIDRLAFSDVVVFLTQDAILANPDAIKNIVNSFLDHKVGVAYGRQLPRRGAGSIESHARYFNYPADSRIRSINDKNVLGMKTVFTSNSFAAYRIKALKDVGGFPSNTIVSEDMFVAAKMLIHGWNIAYCANAQVFHSHGYSLFQEFQRYFDIGVFNARESWIRKTFGQAEKEGGRFVKSEIQFLFRNNPLLIPVAIFRTGLKFMGYRLGIHESKIPLPIKRMLSMQKNYWG